MGERRGGQEPISVSDAVALAKGAVSSWPTLVVNGEVSGFRGPNARSGHCYFEVKDDGASMSVIVWRGTAAKMGFQLRDGLAVQLTGKFDVYQASGRLSFVASRVEAAGEGLLRQQVAELARRLEREGLMDPARKRRIPAFCSRVCVVTSLSGSVIEDVRRTLARRNPLVEIDVVGCSVQGADAPATIMRALGVAAASRPEAILLVRGGGSFEDLMCFNDEALARAIAACPVPVVTGIGHEPDTTIADRVADRRASTPTAAAHEQDRVRAGGRGRGERADDGGGGGGALHRATHDVDLDERVAPRERAFDVLDDASGKRGHHADARAEHGDVPLAFLRHEALALEPARELGHLLAEQPLARRLNPARDEGELARGLVDVELARELHGEAVAQLEAHLGCRAAPDDDAHGGALVLHLEVAVARAGVGPAEARDLARDDERRPGGDGALGERHGVGDGQGLGALVRHQSLLLPP